MTMQNSLAKQGLGFVRRFETRELAEQEAVKLRAAGRGTAVFAVGELEPRRFELWASRPDRTKPGPTPRPWRYAGQGFICDSNGRTVARCPTDLERKSASGIPGVRGARDANGRLIVLAVEYLDALAHDGGPLGKARAAAARILELETALRQLVDTIDPHPGRGGGAASLEAYFVEPVRKARAALRRSR